MIFELILIIFFQIFILLYIIVY